MPYYHTLPANLRKALEDDIDVWSPNPSDQAEVYWNIATMLRSYLEGDPDPQRKPPK